MVFWCPDWPIVAARAESTYSAEQAQAPLATYSGHYIVACSAEARTYGVAPGQRLRDAQQRCPNLHLVHDQPERDQRVFDRVLSYLTEVTPQMSILEPGLIAVRARGVARYYGSERAAVEAIVRALESTPIRLRVRAAIADRLFTARTAAIYATNEQEPLCEIAPGADAPFLSPLSLETLENPALVSTLRHLGFARLADFAALEADHVVQRFGPEAALLHACVRGEDSRPIHPDDLPATQERQWNSEQPLTRCDELAFALVADSEAFIADLVRIHLVCQEIRITMVDDRGGSSTRTWAHPRFFTASDIVNRVRWQWQSLATETTEEYLEYGINRVVLEPISTAALSAHEPGLWGHSGPDSRLEHQVARLQSALGHRAVGRGHLDEGYRWSERQAILPWGEPSRSRSENNETRWPGSVPPPFPATVFDPPHVVSLHDCSGSPVLIDTEGSRLSGDPAALVTPRSQRPVSAWAGPWPVLERWWDRTQATLSYRLQLLDDQGIGWLVSQKPPSSQWDLEAKYD